LYKLERPVGMFPMPTTWQKI